MLSDLLSLRLLHITELHHYNTKVKIELIPLIELPTFKYKDLESVSDIMEKCRLLIERNYLEVQNLEPVYKFQYRISEINDADLSKAIELHVSDLPLKESCSLFGGYALKVNDEIVLYPQCCGLLSEINDWKKLLNENFESFYLSECHPAPKFIRVKDEIHIVCDADEAGPFQPKTNNLIIVNYDSLLTALNNLLVELEKLSDRLNNLSLNISNQNLSKILIWSEE